MAENNEKHALKGVINMNSMYLILQNSDKKKWILPEKNLKVALCLYQPSSLKGRMLKFILPVISRFSMISSIIYKMVDIEKRQLDEMRGLNEIIKEYLDDDIYIFAYFMGTPSSKHQKCTIQISNQSDIKAYCKVSQSDEILNLFKKEKDILDELHVRGINNVPVCLFAGRWKDGNYYFMQSTVKTLNSKTVHIISNREMLCLRDLTEKTLVELPFEETDYYQDIQWLAKNIDCLKIMSKDLNCLTRILDNYLSCKGTTVSFGVSHGDFTPWNCFDEKGNLFVFDFEYAKRTYPPFLDLFHFYIQTAIFERHLSAREIMMDLEGNMGLHDVISDFIKNPYRILSMYLISIISVYTKRDSGLFSSDDKMCIETWLDLLNILCEKYSDTIQPDLSEVSWKIKRDIVKQ